MASDSAERIRGIRLVKPIVYGNTAVKLAHPTEEGHTHQWTVFLKTYHIEDPSLYIRKVQFKLHESYENPTRVVERPPYEVTETGWGEFEVQIRIYFIDVNEKPVSAFHYLRLFAPVFQTADGEDIVVAEYYDEIVFQEPTSVMKKAIAAAAPKKCDSTRFYNNLAHMKRSCMENMKAAREELGRELDDLRDSLRDAHRLLVQYNEQLDDSNPSTPRASVSDI